jgi:hypothetical protein
LHPHRFGARFRVIESWIHRRRHGLREKESILYIYSEVREKRKRTRTKIRERERRGKRQKWRKRERERERESRKFNVKSNAHFSSYFYVRIVFFCLCV